MKIAIIGSGIAGLTAAYRMSRRRIGEVTLLESQSRAGIDAHRVELSDGGNSVTVDVPSRMFNDIQWPSLSRLYDEVGVRSVPVNTSQSFSTVDGSKPNDLPHSYLRNDDGTRPGKVASQLLSRVGRTIGAEALKFYRVGSSDLQSGFVDHTSRQTLGEYLRHHSFDEEFIYRFLYPTLSSTVCTCRYESLDRYPAYVVLKALANLIRPGKLLRTRFGTADVADRLSHGKINIRNNVRVDSITKSDHAVDVRLMDGTGGSFDHVVVATQANTALSMLADPDPKHRSVLGAIRYDEVPVCIHYDSRVMPKRKSHWSTFNMLTEDSRNAASCTVWLNRFYGTWKLREPVFQTIGGVGTIDPSKVIRSTKLYRSVVDQQSMMALDELDRMHQEPDRRIWFCGSWASRGVPLLESAVCSAERVSELIDARTQQSRSRESVPGDSDSGGSDSDVAEPNHSGRNHSGNVRSK